MARAWMPLYIADYLADTAHLSAAEHGAYLLLIMHYWQHGGLPDDSKRLARIARMTPEEWSNAEALLAEFFEPGWKHKRIDAELTLANEKHEKRVAAGRKGGAASAGTRTKQTAEQTHGNDEAGLKHDLSNAQAGLNQSQSQSQKSPSSAKASEGTAQLRFEDPAREERDLFDRGKQILGKNAGGLITNLLKAKDRNIALARAAIEQASTKHNPREFVSRIIAGPPNEARPPGWDSLGPGYGDTRL